MRAAISTGALHVAPAATSVDPFVPLDRPAPGDPPALLAVYRGACVFFNAGGDRLCEIHRALGHDALPLACRQFPRVSVHEPRGTSVTLSHFCPTAASMLDSSGPVAIVTSAPAFPSRAEYSGLDATTSLPPLLRPDVLMDWHAWWEMERRAVEVLSTAPVDIALARLALAVETTRTWRPTDGDLVHRVTRAFDEATTAANAAAPPDEAWLAARRDAALEAIPVDLRAQAPAFTFPADRLAARVLSRFLAAHAFANWTAHLGSGLRSWLRSIEIAYAVATATHSLGEADLLLRHLVDPPSLAAACGRAEEISGTRA